MKAAVAVESPLLGRDRPRVAPPTPARSLVDAFVKTADELGIDLFPWQRTAARYLTALGQGDAWLYRHVAIVVARQNGKTRLLVPLIVSRLRMGHRIMHTAQDRNLPREVFGEVADIMAASPGELGVKNGRIVMPRFANGQEEIRMRNGGIYSIVAPTRGGARGPSRDLVIIDELREMTDHDFIAAANPTLQASASPQMLYLSNAGDDSSAVLNAIKTSAGTDPRLAYLEWSAGPDRAIDDRLGWAESNPSIGYLPGILGNLESDLETYRTRGTTGIFETENLCRWVPNVREPLVSDGAWSRLEADIGDAQRPFMGISMDPEGTRASAGIAWAGEESVAFRLLFDVTGSPINTDKLGRDLRAAARSHRVAGVGFDPMTDAMLAKYLPRAKPIAGAQYANASARFVSSVEAGRVAWAGSAAVGTDLSWTARKPHEETGSFQAVRARDDRPITAALAAIRAVWLASAPRPQPVAPAPSAAGF